MPARQQIASAAIDVAPGLVLEAVDAGYSRGEPVLRSISAGFKPGRVTAIIGPNGAGKTTLLRVVLGLLAPTRGRVTLGGTELQTLSTPARAARLAYAAQSPSVAFGFSAAEAIRLGVHPGRSSEPAVERVVAAMALALLLPKRVDRLSAGQRQRVAIGRALIQILATSPPGPRFLLADEPAGPLDPVAAVDVMETLRSLAQTEGFGLIAVMHDLSLADRVADEVVVLNAEGRVTASGLTAQVLTEAMMASVFGGSFAEVRDAAGQRMGFAAIPRE